MNDDRTLASGIDVKTIAELGRDAAGIELLQITTDGLGDGLPPSVPVIWDRKNGETVDVRRAVEDFRLLPQRRTGTAKVLTLQSFIDLTKRHQSDDSAIFAQTDWRAPSLTTVVDYHTLAHDPRHLGHRVRYEFPLTEEWKAWLELDGKVMEQGEFAAFIEDRLAELASPFDEERIELEGLFQTKIASPAELMQLSRGLQVVVGATVKTAKTLQSGEAEIIYEETHRDAAGNKLVVPGLFMLGLSVFVDGAPVRIPVRLRYRAAGGSIKWFYQIYRPDRSITERVREDLGEAVTATGLPAYEGSPEQ